jgi:hypothetical protein
MHSQQLNRMSGLVLMLLSLVALLTVVTGLIWPPSVPQPDEGTQAHLFQLSIAGLLPVTVLVVGTADWHRPWQSARPIMFAAVATMLAFSGLYYLEHLR